MKFRLEFDMDNAAFDDNEVGANQETARILKALASKIALQGDNLRLGDDEGPLYDINGNRIGVWWVE